MTLPYPGRFFVVVPQGLGDSLEATPLIRALRRARPNAVIDVAVTEKGPRLLFESLVEYVDEVLYLPYWELGMRAFLRAVATAGPGRTYDASFLCYPSARPAYEMLLSVFAAERRYAHRHAKRMLLDLPWLHTTLVEPRRAHNVERNRDLLRAAGIAVDDEMGYLVPQAWVAPPEDRHPDRIAIHAGSIAHSELAFKRWPLEHFAELAKRLVERHAEVTLIVGPAEERESAELMARTPGLRRFEGTLPNVARFLSTCGAVIANDNGIAHLAAGVGAPVVTIFGPTPTEFAPFAANAVAFRPSQCPPCFDVRRPVVRCVLNIDFQCLKRDASVDRVFETVESVLQTPVVR